MYETVTAKYDGKYYEFPVAELDLDPESPVDTDIRTALSQRIAADLAQEAGGEPADFLPDLSAFHVTPPENERTRGMHADKTVLSLRPEAPFG